MILLLIEVLKGLAIGLLMTWLFKKAFVRNAVYTAYGEAPQDCESYILGQGVCLNEAKRLALRFCVDDPHSLTAKVVDMCGKTVYEIGTM